MAFPSIWMFLDLLFGEFGIDSLRQNQEKACEFQREKYPARILKGLTRIVAFPEFKEIPGLFYMEKVKEFREKGMWERKISIAGQVEFGNQRFYLGKQHNRQLTYATYLSDK